jgi:hypothetical protein
MVSQLPPRNKDAKTDVDLFEGEVAPLEERGTLGTIAPKQLPVVIAEKLGQIFTPEGLSGPLQLIYRPILFSAIGIHALLILVPGAGKGHDGDKKPAEAKEKPVTITQIATGKASPKLPTVKLPTAKLPTPKISLPKLNLPSSSAPILPSTSPKIEAAPPEAQASTATPTRDNTPAPPLPNLAAGGATTPDSSSGGGAQAGNPFEDFVHHPAAQPSEDGGYRTVAGKSMADVGSFFKTTLGGKKFEVTQSADESSRQVYQVTKGGVTNVITIFADGSDVIYVLAPAEIKDLESLKSASVVPAQFTNGMGQLSGVAAAYADFAEPSSYMDVPSAEEAGENDPADLATQKPNIVDSPKIFANMQQAQAYAAMLPILKASFKGDPIDAGTYGGGQLYELNTGKSKFYLNIVSRRNPAGDSIVVMFSAKPN